MFFEQQIVRTRGAPVLQIQNHGVQDSRPQQNCLSHRLGRFDISGAEIVDLEDTLAPVYGAHFLPTDGTFLALCIEEVKAGDRRMISIKQCDTQVTQFCLGSLLVNDSEAQQLRKHHHVFANPLMRRRSAASVAGAAVVTNKGTAILCLPNSGNKNVEN